MTAFTLGSMFEPGARPDQREGPVPASPARPRDRIILLLLHPPAPSPTSPLHKLNPPLFLGQGPQEGAAQAAATKYFRFL